MAGVGTLAVVGVLVGLQCGGIDRCFVGLAKDAAPVVEPAQAAEMPVAEERLVADQVIAAKPPVRDPQPDQHARQIAALIGDSFDAIHADDKGWLSGAYSPAVAPAVAVEKASQPVVTKAAAVVAVPTPRPPVSEAGKQAVAAIAALDKPAAPDELSVTAFADQAQVPDDPPPKKAPEAIAAVASGQIGTVAGSGANVRSGPGKSHETLFALAGGKKVTVGEDKGGWLKVTDEQGRSGWIYKTYVN